MLRQILKNSKDYLMLVFLDHFIPLGEGVILIIKKKENYYKF